MHQNAKNNPTILTQSLVSEKVSWGAIARISIVTACAIGRKRPLFWLRWSEVLKRRTEDLDIALTPKILLGSAIVIIFLQVLFVVQLVPIESMLLNRFSFRHCPLLRWLFAICCRGLDCYQVNWGSYSEEPLQPQLLDKKAIPARRRLEFVTSFIWNRGQTLIVRFLDSFVYILVTIWTITGFRGLRLDLSHYLQLQHDDESCKAPKVGNCCGTLSKTRSWHEAFSTRLFFISM